MLRLSSSPFPSKLGIAKASGLPYGALVAPLAPSPGLDDAALGKYNALEPGKRAGYVRTSAPEAKFIPRCFRCAAYISRRCQLTVRTWRCVLCGAQNTLPSRYLSVVRAGNAALTAVPELSRRTYDVPVADVAPVTPLAYVFVIDVFGDDTYLDTMRVAVRRALDVVEGESYAAVVLYGSRVQLLDTRPAAQGGDAARAEAPAIPRDYPVANFPPAQWLRRTGPKLTDAIIGALGRIRATPPAASSADAAAPSGPQRALGPAVRCALDMIEGAAVTGARVVVLAGGEPNFGDGALDRASLASASSSTSAAAASSSSVTLPIAPSDTAPEDRFPSPASPFYVEQGMRASMLGSVVDVYMTSSKPVDVASLAPLAQFSGGRLLVYDDGVPTADAALPNDLWQHLNDPTLIRGLLRMRTTPDLLTSEVYGCGLFRDADVDDVFRLACHGHTSTLAVEFGFPEKPPRRRNPQNASIVQIAVRGLFVEPGMLPQRVLRIETVEVDVIEQNVRMLWDGADANAIATIMFHKAVAASDELGIAAARVMLFDWLAQLVVNGARFHPRVTNANSTKENEQNGLNGQNGNGIAHHDDDNDDDNDERDTQTWLDGYEGLRALPQLVFGLIRSVLFRQESVAADVRSATRCIWEDLSPELLSAAAYPKLVSFRDIGGGGGGGGGGEGAGGGGAGGAVKSVEPSDVIGWALPLSSAAVRRCGHDVFLIDALSEVVVYYTARGCATLTYPPPDGSVVSKVKAQCMRDRPITPSVVVCRQGTSAARWFDAHLIEDGGIGASQSYKQFMQGIKDTAGLA